MLKKNQCAIDRMLQLRNPHFFPSKPASHQQQPSLPLRSGRGKRRCGEAAEPRERRRKEKKAKYKKLLLTAEVDDCRVVAARPLPVQAPEHGGGDADGATGASGAALGAGDDARVERGAKGESHVFFFCLSFLFFLQSFLKK